MKRFFKISSYILIAIIFSVALSGCTKKAGKIDPKSKQIIVWSFEDPDVWKPVAKEFALQNKGYTIVYKQQTFDAEYENRVLNSILSDQGPDVWNMPSDWVYRHKNKLFYTTKTGKGSADINKYVQSITQSVMFDNKIYALSSYAEPLMVYYNPNIFENTLEKYNEDNKGPDNANNRAEAKSLLERVPRTWTNFIKTANLITKKNSDGGIELSGVAMGTNNISNSTDVLYLLMMENETTIVSPDFKQANFNLPIEKPTGEKDFPGLRALEFYTSFANPNSENYSWDDSLGNDIEAFAKGKTAMIFGYSSLSNELAQKYPNFKYKKGFMPQLTAESSKVVDYAKSNVFGVNALVATNHGNSPEYKGKPDACWRLINILSSGAPAGGFNTALKVYSSLKSSGDVTYDDRITNTPEKVSLATAKSLVKGRYPTEFDKIIRASITAINEGTQDSQSALDTAARDITDLLRKTSW